jgi:hypothetical protein
LPPHPAQGGRMRDCQALMLNLFILCDKLSSSIIM